MIKKHKKFYEIDRYQIDQSLEQLIAFFDIIKAFTHKCHTHLKYLIYLVNNLIESEDFLELVDQTLHHEGVLKLSKNFFFSQKTEENFTDLNTGGARTQTPKRGVDHLYTSILQE